MAKERKIFDGKIFGKNKRTDPNTCAVYIRNKSRMFLKYGYADPLPPSLRSGQLDIKDAHCAKKNYGRTISYHIISRLDAADVQKGRFWHPKIQLSSKGAKFAG